MNPLQKNPETGFLESPSPNSASFSSDKKMKFLELAHQAAERSEHPSIFDICKTVGVKPSAFYNHLKWDTVFKAEYELALRHLENGLTKVMVMNAQRPSGYMDRITWLRRHFKEWEPGHQVQIVDDSGSHKNILSAIPQIIDAEIVETPENPPENGGK